MSARHVRKELAQAGANRNEAESLARLADQLATVKTRGLSVRAKRRMYSELPVDVREMRRPALRWAFAGSLAGAMALLVVVANVVLPGLRPQSAQPGDEKIQTSVQPSRTDEILQERQSEIEQLEQQAADPAAIEQAKKDYQETYDQLRSRYQDSDEFRDYNWDKWQRSRQRETDQQKTPSSRTNTPSTHNQNTRQ